MFFFWHVGFWSESQSELRGKCFWMKMILLKDNCISGMDSLMQLCGNGKVFILSIIVLSHSDSQLLSCLISYTPWQLRPNKDVKKCPTNYTKTFHTAVRPIPLQTKTGTCGPINGPPQPSAMPAGKLCRGGSINPQIKGCIYSWSSWLILTNPILKNCIDCAVFTWLGTANRMRQCFMILSNFNISRGPKSVMPFW